MDSIAKKFAANWVLMVDAYPQLDPLSDTPSPASDMVLSVCDPQGKLHQKTITLGGHPDIIQARIAKAAMAYLRTLLS